GVTRRNTDSRRAPNPAATAGSAPHWLGRKAGGTSRQLTRPCASAVAFVLPAVSGTATVSGILTFFSFWFGGTGVSGCKVTMVLTPVHICASLHDEMPVVGSPSSHTSPTLFRTSAGHAALLPLHVPALSHGFVAGRHSCPAGRNAHVDVQQAPGVPLAAAPRSH